MGFCVFYSWAWINEM